MPHSHSHSYMKPGQVPDNQKLVRLCTIFAICIAGSMVLMKLFAWYVTGSVTMLSSLMDSSMDLIVSGINFIAIRYAFKPADNDHRFGHSKAQDLAALAQASFIIYLSIVITIEAIKKFIHPVPIEDSATGIVITLIALGLTIILISYQKYVFKKTASTLIHADSAHYLTDVVSNISVIIVLIVSKYYNAQWLDPLLGLLLAAYVLKSGIGVGIIAFNNLMDKELEDAKREEIMAVILSHEQVKTITELKTRTSGHKLFIQFDFTMDGGATLDEAHKIAHEVEAKLLEKFPDCEVFMHPEPD